MQSPTSASKRSEPPGQDPAKKRRKGATRLSCAECRRLKLRCDRTIPCSSCVKRGCAAICPDGSLTTGQGNRFVLASTQELHEKISQLSTRVRELEDALRSEHSQLANDSHPLLTEDLLKIKAPLQRDPQATITETPPAKEEEGGPEVSDALGTLALSKSGKARYYGGPAGSWYFLQNENEDDVSQFPSQDMINLQNLLPAEILTRASAFPVSNNPSAHMDSVTQQSLLWYLPGGDVTRALRDIYFTRAAWLYNPISRAEFDELCYSVFYDSEDNVNSNPDDDPSVAHRLSLLFMVLAIGCVLDPNQAPYNGEAEKFNQLGRAALFLNPFVEEPTIHAVQTLHLMTFYLFLTDRHGAPSGIRWAIMGVATKLAQSIGLHRDSAKWKDVDPAETQRRRETFWELFTYDSWQCLTFGRPPSFALAHLDCKMPYTGEPSDDNAFHVWKYRFTSDCMATLHDQAYNAKAPTYATVLQLDRKLRAFPVPSMLQISGFGNADPRAAGTPDSIALMLQRHLVLSLREANLLFLHRSFFARAISEHPQDPLGSPYGTSVIAAYRSAGSLIALMKNLRNQLREPTDRMWFLWSHSFTSAVILGSIVTRCPSMSLAPSALVQLDSACDMFEKAAKGFRAEKVYTIMNDLRQRAHTALNEFRSGKLPSSVSSGPGMMDLDTDELRMLGGQSRLIKKESTAQSPTAALRSPEESPIVPLPMPVADAQMDHNLLEYLNSFGNNGPQPLNNGEGAGPAPYTSELSGAIPMFTMSPNPVYSTGDQQMTSYMMHSNPSSPVVATHSNASHPQLSPVTAHHPRQQHSQQQMQQQQQQQQHQPQHQQQHPQQHPQQQQQVQHPQQQQMQPQHAHQHQPQQMPQHYQPLTQPAPPPQHQHQMQYQMPQQQQQQHMQPQQQQPQQPQQQQQQHMQPQQQQQQQQQHQQAQQQQNAYNMMSAFPQYFPVFDYGTAAGTGDDLFGAMLEQMPGQSTQQRQRSTSASPEGNTLNSTWNEFITSNGYA